MTIVQNIAPETFAAIKAAKQTFIILRTKITPTLADKLLMQEYAIDEVPGRHTGNELPIMQVTHIETDGLHKGWYAVGFNLPVEPAALDEIKVVLPDYVN